MCKRVSMEYVLSLITILIKSFLFYKLYSEIYYIYSETAINEEHKIIIFLYNIIIWYVYY